jgi:tetratricopeptide (TPR) repeat protein
MADQPGYAARVGPAQGTPEAIRVLRERFDYAGARELAASMAADGDPLALVELGRLEGEFGDCERAIATFERALETATGPLRSRAMAGLVMALTESDRYEQAEQVAADAVTAGDRSSRLQTEAGSLASMVSNLGLAEERLKLALERADGDEDRVHALAAVIDLRRHQGRYQEARELLDQAIPLAERAFGERSLELGGLLNLLGMIGKFDGNFDDADSAYTRSLAIFEGALGPNAEPLATTHHNLGGLAHARRDFAGGEPHGRRSVEIRTAARGPDDVKVAFDKAAWASLLDGVGDHDQAERLFREAIATLQAALGPDHPEVAVNLNNLAALLARRGERAAAEQLYRRSLAAKEHAVGGDGPTLAPTLNNLGVLLKQEGRLEEAAVLFRRALASLEGQVADDHPTLRSVRRNAVGLDV